LALRIYKANFLQDDFNIPKIGSQIYNELKEGYTGGYNTLKVVGGYKYLNISSQYRLLINNNDVKYVIQAIIIIIIKQYKE
jgi:hypothetical protein